MSIINNMERLEMLECVQEFGFAKGAEIYWIHRFKNLLENQHKSRRQIEYDIIEIFKLPKFSKSTFDKTYAMYQKILPKLMTYEIKSKLEMFSNSPLKSEEDNENEKI